MLRDAVVDRRRSEPAIGMPNLRQQIIDRQLDRFGADATLRLSNVESAVCRATIATATAPTEHLFLPDTGS
ncbi:MAG: hypothetical protein EKK33_01985 [Bradyrhizobiaceae bacterium]|nr:MAG: hypothetical protein EKK33_01985 [Bradyrhizobiaceae bacterium]